MTTPLPDPRPYGTASLTHGLRLLTLVIALLVLSGCVSSSKVEVPSYLGASRSGAGSISAPDQSFQTAGSELEAARQAAGRQDKQSVRKHLTQAENLLGEVLRADPHSRAAAEMLGEVYYYKGLHGDKESLRTCTDFLKRVLDVDPDAEQAARILARAFHQIGDERRAIKYANYTESISTNPEVLREMSELRRPLQEKFLTSWNDYENFYETDGARLTRLNLQTYKFDVVLQVTPQLENELAAQSFQQLSSTMKLSQDAAVRDYLQKVVDRLVSRTPGPPFTYRVELIDSPEVNAYALPGRVMVNAGLLKLVESEAELVAVLSHELAHIYAHHSARQLLANMQNQEIAGSLLALVNADDDRYRQMLNLGASVGLELLERGYSRQQEKEADRLGTHIAYNAGYNPTFMTSFFIRLFEANPKQPPRLLSTHPPTTDRIEYTTAYLDNYPLDVEMQIDSQDFQEMKRRVQ